MAVRDAQTVPLRFHSLTAADLARVLREASLFCLCPAEPVMVYGRPVKDERLCVRCAARQALNMLGSVGELLKVKGN